MTRGALLEETQGEVSSACEPVECSCTHIFCGQNSRSKVKAPRARGRRSRDEDSDCLCWPPPLTAQCPSIAASPVPSDLGRRNSSWATISKVSLPVPLPTELR